MRTILIIGLGAAALTLGACGPKPSAVAPSGSEEAAAPPSETGASATQQVALVNGEPMWAANRRHTATENAQYQFARNGGEFGARSESDYVVKVHNFVDHPPRGSQIINRSNGDRVIYAPSQNIFAVVSKDGAPRTMFKPATGAAYWSEEKTREAKEAQGYGRGYGQSDGSRRYVSRREGSGSSD
ncbi:MAG: hypothetical protein ACRED8_07385, partial [Caulobacteraceae bacterium]